MFEKEFLIILLLLGIAGWFWADSMRAREVAVRYCKQMCDKEGWEFLDQTVVMQKMWIRRNGRGRLQWRRVYAFDYSTNGGDRLVGTVVMLGSTVLQLNMLSREDFTVGY